MEDQSLLWKNLKQLIWSCKYYQEDELKYRRNNSVMGKKNYFYDLGVKPFLNNLPNFDTLDKHVVEKIK